MSVPTGQSKLKHLEAVSSFQNGSSTKSQGLATNVSPTTPGVFRVRVEFTRKRSRDALSFLFVRNSIGNYPDTGESGDAYDAELFVEC